MCVCEVEKPYRQFGLAVRCSKMKLRHQAEVLGVVLDSSSSSRLGDPGVP